MPKRKLAGTSTGQTAKSSIFKQISGNVKRNANKNSMTSLAFAAIGGFLYPVIPTVIQGFSGKDAKTGAYKLDMSGWKGVLAGGLSTTLLGMAANKMEIAYGGFAAMITHLTYVKANDTVASLTGSPIFAFDKSSALNQVLSDEVLPPGMEWITLPNGQRVKASSGTGVSDFTNVVSDFTNETGVGDFVNELADFVPNTNPVPQQSSVMSDYFDDWTNGNFN